MAAPVADPPAVSKSDPKADSNRDPPVFQLGLALAGAISAGAYTAGVLDFLFQALSEWEARRGQPGVPKHRVVLKVVAGASAGAITGALSAIALARGLQPREFTQAELDGCYEDPAPEGKGAGGRDRAPPPKPQEFKCVLPSLYRTWVDLPDMIGREGSRGFLDTDDVDTGRDKKPVLRSLLNALLLDDIKRIAILPPVGTTATIQPVPYVAARLHVYVTVSNMRGIPFRVEFGNDTYGMQTIGDRIHYVVTGLGTSDLAVRNSWVELDASGASLPISVDTLPRSGETLPVEWADYGTAALASGAFPIGLASRELRFAWTHYNKRRYPIPLAPTVEINLNFPPGIEKDHEQFVFDSVDGGLVNNSPFDYAQYALAGHGTTGPADGQTVDKAVVMVAPFPEPPAFLPEGLPGPAFMAIARALFPALVNQSRFRASEIAPAVDTHDRGRFLIAPLRSIPGLGKPKDEQAGAPRERYAIACGLLGGFGGFLDEKFRAHDFQLGRRNCQRFLLTTFRQPGDNVIVGEPGGTGWRPLIPLLGSAADPVPLPHWPRMSVTDFERICTQTVVRLDAVVPLLIEAQTASRALRTALKIGWSAFMRARTIEFVRLIMLADLIRRGQIDDSVDEADLPAVLRTLLDQHKQTLENVRAIVAELNDPAFDFRTVEGIEKATKLPHDFIVATLRTLTDESVPLLLRAWGDDRGWTTFARQPSRFAQRPVVRFFNEWWNKPSTN